jgi:murein DD-endopeptidase MepM/ murein hydrolase activator NlpD
MASRRSSKSRRRRLLLLAGAAVVSTLAGATAGAALTPSPRSARPAAADPRATPVKASPVQPLALTSAWGPRRYGFHSGVDLRAREGTPLRSVGPGVVEKTGRGGNGGLRVVVRLDDGWRAGYAHLSRVDVARGQRVEAGTRIGLAGATGRATGPHLHFELREPGPAGARGRLVDPWPHLRPHARGRFAGSPVMSPQALGPEEGWRSLRAAARIFKRATAWA